MASSTDVASSKDVPRPKRVRGSSPHAIILGAGVTGLGAGWTSGLPVYEAAQTPGGICASYYQCPGQDERLNSQPRNGEAWRFEFGGGHWIFGGDAEVLRLIQSLAPVRSYQRRSGVYLPDDHLMVPYPIQNHLRCLGPEIAQRVLGEITKAAGPEPGSEAALASTITMAEWLRKHFGPTLYDKFFGPFHSLYTVQLHTRIAPQDAYKSPINFETVRLGAQGEPPPTGYNVSFVYPEGGLDTLARGLAARCDIHYGKRAKAVDIASRTVHFEDGTVVPYQKLLSTLPLPAMMTMAGLKAASPPDPHTSVLVLNIGARKGPHCPSEHWVYIPRSQAGFYRVGIYSQIEKDFLPRSKRAGNFAALYVESAFLPENRPDAAGVRELCRRTVEELQSWRWIEEIEVLSPTWIDVAYTWSLPGSTWRAEALSLLEAQGIQQVGRYGRWSFQGIADSVREGMRAGEAVR